MNETLGNKTDQAENQQHKYHQLAKKCEDLFIQNEKLIQQICILKKENVEMLKSKKELEGTVSQSNQRISELDQELEKSHKERDEILSDFKVLNGQIAHFSEEMKKLEYKLSMSQSELKATQNQLIESSVNLRLANLRIGELQGNKSGN